METEKKRLIEVMSKGKELYFGKWSLKDIVSFITSEYLLLQKMRIDHTVLSRIFTKGETPGKDKTAVLLDIFSIRLPKRTVTAEDQLIAFRLLPGPEEKLED